MIVIIVSVVVVEVEDGRDRWWVMVGSGGVGVMGGGWCWWSIVKVNDNILMILRLYYRSYLFRSIRTH